jgi:hypothetical protein
MDYYQKYMKYKIKYLQQKYELQAQQGGDLNNPQYALYLVPDRDKLDNLTSKEKSILNNIDNDPGVQRWNGLHISLTGFAFKNKDPNPLKKPKHGHSLLATMRNLIIAINQFHNNKYSKNRWNINKNRTYLTRDNSNVLDIHSKTLELISKTLKRYNLYDVARPPFHITIGNVRDFYTDKDIKTMISKLYWKLQIITYNKIGLIQYKENHKI